MRRIGILLALLAAPLAQPALAQPALAQSAVAQPAPPAADQTAGDQQYVLPALPAPEVPDNAAPAAFIRAAETALAAGRTGEAEEAIERAEARLLDRDIDPRRIDDPSRNPVVALLGRAAAALRTDDRMQAVELLEQAQRQLAQGAPAPQAAADGG